MNISASHKELAKPSSRRYGASSVCVFGETLLVSHMAVLCGDILGLYPNKIRMHFCTRMHQRIISFVCNQKQVHALGAADVRLYWTLTFIACPIMIRLVPVAQQRLLQGIKIVTTRKWIEKKLRSSLYNSCLVSRHFRHIRAFAILPKFKRPKPGVTVPLI